MSLPGNGIFVVQGEMNILVTAMRRSTRWGSHSFLNEEYDVLMRTFQDLKIILNQVDDLRLLDPATFLSPFLEVIRSKETTGPVTTLALSAIHKFLSYGLIDPTHRSVPATVEDIAEAVTHARFVGTDHSSDGVVLMKILQVLRTLMLSPEGVMLTDESVCEIMLSCFRICFETRLTELLRRNAEQCLRDMTQLIFMRLPQFPAEDAAAVATLTTGGLSLNKRDKDTKRRSLTTVHSTNTLDGKSSAEQMTSLAENDTEIDSKTESLRHSQDKNLLNEAEITIEPMDVKSPKKHARHSSMDLAANENTSISQLLEKCVSPEEVHEVKPPTPHGVSEEPAEPDGVAASEPPSIPAPDAEDAKVKEVEEYVNHRGIRFRQESQPDLQPYGLVCVRELFRFLISLSNPLEGQNTSAMVHLGLTLVGTALEVSADALPACPSLLALIRDPLCRNLLMLLSTERISIFALDLQVSFLLFEAMRFHLKFQMEAYFKKIIEIISSDTSKAIYELKEIHHLALESLIQFFRIPGLCTELYLNYDCDVYCMNVFEEVTKLLSKNVVSSTAYEIHQLSLEALLTILEAIELGVNAGKQKSEADIVALVEEREETYGRGGHVTLELGGMDDASVVSDHVTHDISQYFGGTRQARHKPTADMPTEAELDNVKNMKKWVTQGTELFNQKPERAIEFLQEHGVLKTPLDPHQVALFLRENPDLDKKMIGEYICKRSSRGEEDDGPSVLGAFADSFQYAGLRIDQALRLYLETFRLPGEAPLIFLVMERFAERWHSTNGEPFANTDAAFRLAYAVIMLNMDQHNHNAKKLNVPMTVEDFVKNLRGCNGSGDFEQGMLEQVFHSIKNEEMVMPAERVGPVRDAYLWRVLQRRGATPGGRYRVQPPHHPHHLRLFTLACPPVVSALSAAFERAAPPSVEEVERGEARDSPALTALQGLERAAALTARLPTDALSLDSLVLTLCKFTGLLAPPHVAYIAIGVSLGQSSKAQAALRRASAVSARHAHALRAAWRHLLEIVNTLYIGLLLPKTLIEVEDYLSPSGWVSLAREPRGNEAGLLSSIYSYIALGETGMRAPTPHEKVLIDAAAECVAKCNLPGLLITETKFLQVESLQELIRAMIHVGTPPDSESLQLNPQLEDITIFFLELLGQTLIQNRDRLSTVWEEAGPHMQRVALWAATRSPHCLTRALTALLRTAARLLRCHQCAPQALQHLAVLFALPYKLFYQQAVVISCGVYELVKTSAQNVHTAAEWDVVFALLCAAGAGAWPNERGPSAIASTSSRSEGSEDESERRPTSASSESELSHSPQTQGWIMVKNDAAAPGLDNCDFGDVRLRPHRAAALARCCEALALVVRDVAHVTPHNCKAAVRAVRIFARATLHAGKKSSKSSDGRKSRPSSARKRHEESSDEEIDTLDQYHMVSIQLLDLMHTLHSRTAQIFKWWRDEAEHEGAEEYDLWEVAWMPLLQGIAQFCTDRRKQVANSAIAYLQRALLAPGLSAMGGGSWEACFYTVLFPLLEQLPRRADATARANTIMCKVFLQHLSALGARGSFSALWLRVVEVQRALVSAPADDPLTEAALESLKNMILVMDSVRIFRNGDGYNDLWYITWNKIGEFLPTLKEELFPEAKDNAKPPSSLPPHMQPPLPASLPTIIPVASTYQTISPNQYPSPAMAPMSPVNISQTPPLVATSPTLVTPTPVSGMVPIRNSLYDQSGLTSVLLQPLNEMKSTPLGVAIQSPIPILYPQAQTEPPFQPQPIQPEPTYRPQPIQPEPQFHPQPIQPEPQFYPQPIQSEPPFQPQPIQPESTYRPQATQPEPQFHPQPIQPEPSFQSQAIQPESQFHPQMIRLEPQLRPQPNQTLQPQPIQTETQQLVESSEPYTSQTEINVQNTILDINYDENLISPDLEQGELYAEYLTDPYNDTKEVTSKEATLYDPGSPLNEIKNPLLSVIDKQKSYSANATPQHTVKAQFVSTDNVRQESSIFNFSSYFGAVNEKSAGEFDSLMPTQEG